MRLPTLLESFRLINDTRQSFNFLKSIDIANINTEIENLHPSTHKFWEEANIRKEFRKYLGLF